MLAPKDTVWAVKICLYRLIFFPQVEGKKCIQSRIADKTVDQATETIPCL